MMINKIENSTTIIMIIKGWIKEEDMVIIREIVKEEEDKEMEDKGKEAIKPIEINKIGSSLILIPIIDCFTLKIRNSL